MRELIAEDMKYVTENSNVDFNRFAGKSVFITGATGLLGRNLVYAFLYANKKLYKPIRVFAYVRNAEKAKTIFTPSDNLTFIVGDVTESINMADHVDYIIHCASQTSSKAFVQEPVETANTAFMGTFNMLKLAREKRVSSFVYLSSMEVYGSPITDGKIKEDHSTDLDPMKVRTCYPESKRMCESLCASFLSEYHVPAKVIRLCQTFGPGVIYQDGRVFAEFGRCVIENRDIVLRTKGNTKRNYLYTADAVTAILTILLDGAPGEAYNAANEETYCSIFEMAELVAKKCAHGSISVKVQEEDESKYGFAPMVYMNLDSTKLKTLGWSAEFDLLSMFERMIQSMRN